MARKSRDSKFNIIVNQPTEENLAEYDLRVGRAVVKILTEALPNKYIDELIERYRKAKKD